MSILTELMNFMEKFRLGSKEFVKYLLAFKRVCLLFVRLISFIEMEMMNDDFKE